MKERQRARYSYTKDVKQKAIKLFLNGKREEAAKILSNTVKNSDQNIRRWIKEDLKIDNKTLYDYSTNDLKHLYSKLQMKKPQSLRKNFRQKVEQEIEKRLQQLSLEELLTL